VSEKSSLMLIHPSFNSIHIFGKLSHISLNPIDILHLLVIGLVIMERSCDLVVVI
jgi:hypothetical protein